MSQYNNRGGAPVRRAPQGQPRPAAARPAGARPAGRPNPAAQKRPMPRARRRTFAGMPRGLGSLLIGGFVAVLLAFMLQLLWPNGFPLDRNQNNAVDTGAVFEVRSAGPIRINEIMTSNSSTLSIEDGTSPDWIEVANIGNAPVNIGGYALSKATNSAQVFTFPEMTLEAGECVLVYADSKLRNDAGESLHAPFRLSSAGDPLLLFNRSGTAIDTVNIPAVVRDSSYARVSDSAWEVSTMVTPGLLNTQENYQALHQKVDNSPVILSEIMSSNASTLKADEGLYYDYIEITNRSGETVDLTGWYLSDDAADLRKWRIPSGSIAPGQAMVIFASGLDKTSDSGQLHTNFRLSSEGETVLLCNSQGRIMDEVSFDLLKSDVAWMLAGDGSWNASLQPSPGRSNF